MAIRGPRLEFSVGAFLLLALASLMVLAVASTNQRWSWGSQGYELKARFSQVGQLRKQAPVKIGGVTVGQVASIDLDPVKFESIVTLRMDSKVKDLPTDTSAGIFTSGLLGESYIGLQPGGDPDVLKAGDEIVFTQPAVDLIQLVGKYMFSGGAGGGAAQKPNDGAQAPATEPQP
ncbi:outer membrane lipid asymmetry maintenance protein MlaD [Stenotrophomonas sepilia]|uniref:outer membrane lipid asymmetry maintenance protein MlaD n=1 Tax=Stenotrophomonas sepilia TaxID=2860290 RepID=UPI0024BD7D2C|nr:outer membrane lipid asymmetry maintenance protein MlaD [Stenotrophomonas sepilia]MDJ1626362.1 outer membrane lipid asymmetry maintenance protein MlaD [Stenotrophomonas sepilia]